MDAFLIRIAAERTAALRSDPRAVADVLDQISDGSDRRLCLEQAWYGIHLALTAELPMPRHEALRRGLTWDDHSLENVLMGGDPTPYETAFGPARLLDPATVARLAQRLDQITRDQLLAQYDPRWFSCNQLPPHTWNDPATGAWLADHFTELVRFYAQAAQQGDSVLIVID